ncbi:PAS domain-containing protein [Robertmurraya korlensis]|uniref:PAS domain-containing protein n=1 Tax=Robertmurraya korlensis TaxID=519977 RepID=UPI00204050CE|nr:PAS domain-containing protein [Robertmurraya korlensis]MCM3601267.1 PAS domain-containing protein [Robertmurraya korlensis]
MLHSNLLAKIINHTRVGVLVTDPSQEDNPIIYASKGFLEMTGYSMTEVIGRNCRFLQGPDTDVKTVHSLRKAIETGQSIRCEILNYRKTGEPFWNELSIDKVYVEEEDKSYFLGIQHNITLRKQAEKEYLLSLQRIDTLTTPIVPINSQLSILPLIGEMNKDRATKMTTTVLKEVTNSHIDTLLLDVSGLTTIDENTYQELMNLFTVLELVGIELIISGLNPSMAKKLSQIMPNDKSIKTTSSVKEYLKGRL